MSIKIFSPIEMGENANIVRDTSTGFPTNPKLGTDTMVDGVLYYFTSIDGGEPVWVPVGNKRSNTVVEFATSALEWVAEHNLGTYDIIATCYDSNNKAFEASHFIISADIIKFVFTTPISGKAVIFGASQKYAGYAPSTTSLNTETIAVGYSEPDATNTSTLYVQLDNVTV